MTEPKMRLEDEGKECLTCEEHGKCSIEFIGGERHLMTPKEMDLILFSYDAAMKSLIQHFDKQNDVREAINEIIKGYIDDGKVPGEAFVSEKEEGFKYMAFVLGEISFMQDLTRAVTTVVKDAKNRADEAYANSTNTGMAN
jgi:hypothetical protein